MHDLLIFYCMDLISAFVYLTALSGAGIRKSQRFRIIISYLEIVILRILILFEDSIIKWS